MTWNESEHPRDELGRFTYQGGSDTQDDENSTKEEDVFDYGGETFKLRIEKTDTNPSVRTTPIGLGASTKSSLKISTKSLNIKTPHYQSSSATIKTGTVNNTIRNIVFKIKTR